MTHNAKSLATYNDIRRTLDSAVANNGLRLEFQTRSKATTFVSRANAFRVLLRQENAAKGGRLESPYDHLMFTRPRAISECVVDIVFRGYDFVATAPDGSVVDIGDKTLVEQPKLPETPGLSDEDKSFLDSFLPVKKDG